MSYKKKQKKKDGCIKRMFCVLFCEVCLFKKRNESD